jgi:uncharacterized protein YecT (DUF1311 family)
MKSGSSAQGVTLICSRVRAKRGKTCDMIHLPSKLNLPFQRAGYRGFWLGGAAFSVLLFSANACTSSRHQTTPSSQHHTTSVEPLRPPAIKEGFTVLPCPRSRAARRTTLGLEGCSEHETLKTDGEINAHAKSIFHLLRDDVARRQFVAAEKAWLAYREKSCISVADVYRGGSAQPVFFSYCVVTRNKDHIKEIASFERFLRRVH